MQTVLDLFRALLAWPSGIGRRFILTLREVLNPGHAYFERFLPYFMAAVVVWVTVILGRCWVAVRRSKQENRTKLIALIAARYGWTEQMTLEAIRLVRRKESLNENEAIHEILAR